MIIEAVSGGILLGILLAALLGPLFFVLLKVSINNGFLAGSLVAIGAVVSDLLMIFLCYHGLMHFLNADSLNVYMGTFGGIVLLIMGIHSILKKPAKFKTDHIRIKFKKRGYVRFFLNGFAINTINPFVFLFWAGIAGVMMIKEHYSAIDISVFFISVLITILITDLLKVYLSGKIRKWLKLRYIFWINKLAGFGLLIFGIHLLSRLFWV